MTEAAVRCALACLCSCSITLGAQSRIEFKSDTIEASELPGGTRFVLKRTPSVPTMAVVYLRVGFGTATPEDVHLDQGSPHHLTVVFDTGENEAQGYIGFVKDDGLPEEDETLTLSLVSIDGPGVLGDRTNATVTVKNGAPAVALHGTSGDFAAREDALFAFELWRHGDTNVAVSVDYRVTTNSTALAGVDFVSSEGRVTFAPGETVHSFFALKDNGKVSSPLAPRPMIELELFNPSTNATILDPLVAQLVIWDNETPATLAPSFSPDFGRQPGISSVAVQPDGKILVAGESLFVGGRQRTMVRLNADGSFDGAFQPEIQSNEPVFTLAALPNGKLMARYGRRGLVRLLPDGRRDASFAPSEKTLAALEAIPLSLATLGTGKVVVGDNRRGFAVLVINEDGSEDTALQGRLRQHNFHGLVEMPDGRLVLRMVDYGADPQGFRPLVRLQADGSVDATFRPPATLGGSIESVLALQDGKLIAESVESSGMARLVRLLPDGSLDSDFQAPLTEGRWVPWFEKEGRLYVGYGLPSGGLGYLLRMDPDGSIDASFSVQSRVHTLPFVGTGPHVPQAVAHQDGILCYTSPWVNDVPRPLARIVTDGQTGFIFRHSQGFAFDAPIRAFEASGSIELTVVRTGNTAGPARIRYRTEGGTALAGLNYIPAAGMLEFASLQTEALIRITLPQDDIFRGRPHFFVVLHDPSVPARLDRPLRVVVHDRTKGMVPGRVITRLDGVREMEFDVTGLEPFDRYSIEASVDLRRWTPAGDVRQFGSRKGSWWLIPEAAPELLEVGPSGSQVFRLVIP